MGRFIDYRTRDILKKTIVAGAFVVASAVTFSWVKEKETLTIGGKTFKNPFYPKHYGGSS